MKLFKNFHKFLIAKQYKRLYCTVELKPVVTSEANDINILGNHGKSSIIRNVQSLLNISYKNAMNVVNENIKLVERNGTFLTENHKVLNENGIDNEIILKYPLLLGVPFLPETIRDLKALPYPLSDTIVLACLVKPKLDKLINANRVEDNKIELISESLQVPPNIACEILYNRDFLVHKDSQTINHILTLLKEFGISHEELQKDLWVFKYSPNIIKSRIELIRDMNIDSPKLWMIRSPVNVIENYARRRTDNRQILGNDSLTQYLSKKLECTETKAKFLIAKMPALTTKSMRTVSDIINFLYSKGFEPYQIIRVPKILVHRVETIKKRLEQLEKAGVRVDSLYILTKSQKQLCQYCEALVKKKDNLGIRPNS